MSGFTFIKTFDRYSDDSAPQTGSPAATGVWALRITKFDAGAKIGFAEDNLRTIRALTHYRRKPDKGVEPFEVYVTGNVAFEYVTSPLDFDVFDGSLSPQSSTDIGANQVVVGPDAPATPIVGNPVLIGGRDATGGILRAFKSDPSGNVYAGIVNPSNGAMLSVVAGAAVPNAALQVGVSDGTNLQRLAGDTAGQVLVEGANSVRPTYTTAPNLTVTVGPTSLYSLEAPAGSPVRIRRLRLWQRSAVQTAAGFVQLQLVRYAGVSSGGTVDPGIAPHDPADSAFGGVGRVGPTGLGTAGLTLARFEVWIPAAVVAREGPIIDRVFDLIGAKALIIPAGIGNTVSLFWGGATGAAGGLDLELTFTVGA